jgi:hypothetical protein
VCPVGTALQLIGRQDAERVGYLPLPVGGGVQVKAAPLRGTAALPALGSGLEEARPARPRRPSLGGPADPTGPLVARIAAPRGRLHGSLVAQRMHGHCGCSRAGSSKALLAGPAKVQGKRGGWRWL